MARLFVVWILAIAALAACADPTGSVDPGPVRLAPHVLASWPNQAWLGPAGARVPDTLVVEATDTLFSPLPGRAIAWTVTAGGGAVEVVRSTTDDAGLARAAWTLGPALGEQLLEATAAGSADTVRFHAIANPPAPDDWRDLLAIGLDVDAAGLRADAPGTLDATLSLTNGWTGTLRVKTTDSCVARARVLDAAGDVVATLPYGCWAAAWWHDIPPGETLATHWTSDELVLGSGDYTVRAALHVVEVNGEPVAPADPERAFTVE